MYFLYYRTWTGVVIYSLLTSKLWEYSNVLLTTVLRQNQPRCGPGRIPCPIQPYQNAPFVNNIFDALVIVVSTKNTIWVVLRDEVIAPGYEPRRGPPVYFSAFAGPSQSHLV